MRLPFPILQLRVAGPALALAALLLTAVGPSAPVSAQTTNHSPIEYQVHPIARFATAAVTPHQFPAPSACVKAFGLACYTPGEMRKAYDVPPNLLGQGQTIVLIDAFGSPTIRQDLATFDYVMGLNNPTFNIFYPEGKPPFNPRTRHGLQAGWAAETSLDVEWAHAMAPDATIDLVIAPTSFGNALDNAVAFAVNHHLGNVLSMSYGAPEAMIRGAGNNLQLIQGNRIFEQAAAEGISVFASAGDSGASNGYTVPNALFPASDPWVTSVGGTNLFMSDSGQYRGETVWNDGDPSLCPFGCTAGIFGATGGAPSRVFSAPAYQIGDGSGFATRTTADVAYNASVYTAVMVYLGFLGPNSGFYFFGGTSEGAPQWAAITALADEAAGHPLGSLNPLLYRIASNSAEYAADFHNVTVGNNAFDGPGYSAGPGYNLPTGLGSPNVAHLIHTLASMP